jgi:hypothetical protein
VGDFYGGIAMPTYRAFVTYTITVHAEFVLEAADKGEAAALAQSMAQEDTFEVQRTGFYHEARKLHDKWDSDPWTVQLRDIVEEGDNPD